MKGKLYTITNRNAELIEFKDYIRNWIKFTEDDLQIYRDYEDWDNVNRHLMQLSTLKVILKKIESIY